MTSSPVLIIPSVPLPFCLEAGISRYAPGEVHPTRRGLGVYDLIVVEEGELYIGEEEQQWEVSAGQMLLLHPDRYHYSIRPCDRDTLFSWLHFTVYPQNGPTPPPYTIQVPQYWTLPSPGPVYSVFQQLRMLSSVRRSEAFWQEQNLFLDLLKQLDESRYQREGSRTLAVAEATEAYIRQHYQEPLSNERLAEELHFHYNYLARCMKEEYGLTPIEYVMKVRLEQAKLLLLKTDWAMPRIAEQVGFEYASYFSRCFRNANGISPLQFRKQYSV